MKFFFLLLTILVTASHAMQGPQSELQRALQQVKADAENQKKQERLKEEAEYEKRFAALEARLQELESQSTGPVNKKNTESTRHEQYVAHLEKQVSEIETMQQKRMSCLTDIVKQAQALQDAMIGFSYFFAYLKDMPNNTNHASQFNERAALINSILPCADLIRIIASSALGQHQKPQMLQLAINSLPDIEFCYYVDKNNKPAIRTVPFISDRLNNDRIPAYKQRMLALVKTLDSDQP